MRSISSRELSEWRAYVRLYGPINPIERADWGRAQISAVLANTARDTKAKPTPYEIADFLPKFEEAKPPDYLDSDGGIAFESADSMLAKIVLMNKAMGGKDLRENKGK